MEQPSTPGSLVAADPAVAHFLSYLEGERNASENTISGYLGDLAQFVESAWGAGARAPFESGFVVRTAQYVVERSLDGWLEERKREMAPRLERELFGGGDGGAD